MQKDQDKILEQIKQLFDANPSSFNVIEEKIDIDLQLNYFKRSKKLKKQQIPLNEIIEKIPLLYDEENRLEERRDILIHLANFEEVEAFRALEKFWKEAEGEIKPWASMAYRESKMVLESSLLDEKQILISTGLGGKGYKLRFFIVFVNNDQKEFSETQQKLIRTEVEYAVTKVDGEFESVVFENEFAKILALIPLNIMIKDVMNTAVEECNQYGNFISENFIITNVKELDTEEIYQVINQEPNDIVGEEDFDDLSDYEEDEDFLDDDE